MTQFSELALSAALQRALAEEGYTTPTPIQAQAIPHALEGRDVLGIAQTGTGKTAAFALPILDRLDRNRKPTPKRGTRVLVLAPTRELATQIADSFRAYGRHMPLETAVVFGGTPINRQIRQMVAGVDVLVATPGRLIDLIDQRALTLANVETLVLDEADQMLDLGFIHALRRIVPLLPRERQTLFFSATMPKTIAELADRYLDNPVQVSVAPVSSTAERVDQRVTFVSASAKPALLRHVLRQEEIDRVLVFTRTKHGADRVVRQLATVGVEAAAIHGNKSQPQREKALKAFRDGACRVLVATDIAARGIDIDGVSHVINYDVPNVPEQYVHRIGRTARAGASGFAISFVANDERPYLRDIEKLTRLKIAVVPAPEGLEAAAAADREANPPERERERQPSRQPRARSGEPGRSNKPPRNSGGAKPQAARAEGGRGDSGRDAPRSGAKPAQGTAGLRNGGPGGKPSRPRSERGPGDRSGGERSHSERGPSERGFGDSSRPAFLGGGNGGQPPRGARGGSGPSGRGHRSGNR